MLAEPVPSPFTKSPPTGGRRNLNSSVLHLLHAYLLLTLHHEVLDDAVERGSLVANRHAVFAEFSSTELAKVFRSFRNDVRKQLHLYTAYVLSADGHIEEDDRINTATVRHLVRMAGFKGQSSYARFCISSSSSKIGIETEQSVSLRDIRFVVLVMAVNLKKNEKALLAAYKDVLNDSTDTKWLVRR